MNKQKQVSPAIKMLGWVVSIIFFLIGFYHTGLGLMEYKVLGLSWGSFILSFGILALLIIAYSRAVNGSETGLYTYILIAFVNFICNLNSFYPNYMGEKLVKTELAEKRDEYSKLVERVKSTYGDTSLNALVQEVEAKSMQVQNQIKRLGLGPLADRDLRDIEALLGGRKITRLKGGRSQNEWNNIAEQYKQMIDEALQAVLAGRRNYAAKLELIRDAEQNLVLLEPKVQNRIDTIQPIKTSIWVITETVDTYKRICNRGVELAKVDANTKFSCNDKITVDNEELGRFTHTFRSIWNSLSELGTLVVLFICLLIDFIIPLLMYRLLKNSDTNPTFWFKKPNEPGGLDRN